MLSKWDRPQWIHMCRDKESHVRSTTCQTNINLLNYKEPITTWVPKIQTHSRLLESQMVTGHIFIVC